VVLSLSCPPGAALALDASWGEPGEHELVVVDSDQAPPLPPLDEDLPAPSLSDWPGRHLALGRDFADAFLGTVLYPELSVGSSVMADGAQDGSAFEFSSWVTLQLYLLEVRLPVVSMLDGAREAQHARLDLKIPFAVPGDESHRFALTGGAVVLESGPAFSKSSHVSLAYGYGGHGVTVQVRGGYGYEQFMPSQPLRLGLLYGALVGLRAGPFQPMVELDAMHATETQSDRFTLLPALRVFPGGGDALQIGVAGLLTFSRGQDAPGNRFGGVVEVKFTFL